MSEPAVHLEGRARQPEEVRRQAGIALAVNLVVLLFLLGFVSLFGAIAAARGRALAATDPVAADRCVRWAWLLLLTNLLLYVLLAGVGILVLIPAFLAAR